MIWTPEFASGPPVPRGSDAVQRNPARLWILLSAVGCSLAGMILGMTIPDIAAAGRSVPDAADPDAQYVQQMALDFVLSGRQQQALRVVLQRYREEQLQVFRHANFDQLPESLQAELTAARRRQGDRIHELLNDEQRRHFETWSRTNGQAR